MTTASKIPTRQPSAILSAIRHVAAELQRAGERRVAFQYEQPWKAAGR